MSKFDRAVSIFIGMGIWAFVITQIIGPLPLTAHDTGRPYDGHTHSAYAYREHLHDLEHPFVHLHSSFEIYGLRSMIRKSVNNSEIIEGFVSC